MESGKGKKASVARAAPRGLKPPRVLFTVADGTHGILSMLLGMLNTPYRGSSGERLPALPA